MGCHYHDITGQCYASKINIATVSAAYINVLIFLGGTASASSCNCSLFLDTGIQSVVRDCRWKLPLVLGFASSTLRRGQKTGGAYFSSRQLSWRRGTRC